jgi:hypothetical protein
MESRRSIWFCGIAVAAILLLSSCRTVVVHRHPTPRRGYGPPPHAQANGHHKKVVYGYELVYDAGCGLYVVVGMTNWYYHENHFYRLRGDVWEISVRGDQWGPTKHDSLPPGLRVKTMVVTKDNGRGNDVIKTNGNGNSVVKLNGNGNSAARLNGNGNRDGKSNAYGYVPAKSNGNGNNDAKVENKDHGKGKSDDNGNKVAKVDKQDSGKSAVKSNGKGNNDAKAQDKDHGKSNAKSDENGNSKGNTSGKDKR